MTKNRLLKLPPDPHSYFTLLAPASGLYKEKGSKFHAFAFPVTSEIEIKDHLEALKKEYFDARHHCYAWVLGPPENKYRAFDGGEPNHSAGDPILGRIRSRNLSFILVVIVRYFGGVKLGVGGLVQAYREAADAALMAGVVVEKDITLRYLIQYDYPASQDVLKMVRDFDLRILHQEFGDSGKMEIELKLRYQAGFLEKSNLLKLLIPDFQCNPIPVHSLLP